MEIKIQRIHPDAKIPVCAHPGEDLCYDLYAVENVVLEPFKPAVINTGIKMELPKGFGALIRPRSGLGKGGVIVLGGEIDNGYRGEVMVMLMQLGGSGRWIGKGDRVAQLRLEPILSDAPFVEVIELSETVRGDGGFGSTGK